VQRIKDWFLHLDGFKRGFLNSTLYYDDWMGQFFVHTNVMAKYAFCKHISK